MSVEIRITGKNSDNEYWLHLSGGGKSAGLNLGDPKLMICSALLMASSGKTFVQSDLCIPINDPALVALVEAAKRAVAHYAIVHKGLTGVRTKGMGLMGDLAATLAAYAARIEGDKP